MQSDDGVEEGNTVEPQSFRSGALIEAQLTTLLNELRDFIAVNNFKVLRSGRPHIPSILHH